jgi:hypothetical protein
MALNRPDVDADACLSTLLAPHWPLKISVSGNRRVVARSYKVHENEHFPGKTIPQQSFGPIDQRHNTTMVSSTAKNLINYVGKVRPTQITSPAWKESLQKFCEEFESQVS